MITLRGRQYGTAAEIAAALGPDVTPAMVHRWADRDGLARYRLAGGTVVYPLDQATHIEAQKRQSGHGRPRRVDINTLAA